MIEAIPPMCRVCDIRVEIWKGGNLDSMWTGARNWPAQVHGEQVQAVDILITPQGGGLVTVPGSDASPPPAATYPAYPAHGLWLFPRLSFASDITSMQLRVTTSSNTVVTPWDLSKQYQAP